MKTSRFATAVDSDNVSARSDHAAGFVSRMMVRREGLCSVRSSAAYSSPFTFYMVRSRLLCQPTVGLFVVAF